MSESWTRSSQVPTHNAIKRPANDAAPRRRYLLSAIAWQPLCRAQAEALGIEQAAERMGLSGGACETLRRRVLERDRDVCYLCDQLGATEVDHLIEVAAGGTSRMDNLASCHPDCHQRKHREPEWAAERVEMAPEYSEGRKPRMPGTAALQT